MRIATILLGTAIFASTPASASSAPHSMLSYTGGRYPVMYDGMKFTIGMHKKYNSILIQDAIGGGASAKDTTIETFRDVAEKFVSPAGCGIESVAAVTVNGGTWEAEYVCPDGVNLYNLTQHQKAALKRGEPLHISDQ